MPSIRPKGSEKWEHVSDEQLATIEAQTGKYSFRSSYEVRPDAEKPAALPTKKPGQPDYLPETNPDK